MDDDEFDDDLADEDLMLAAAEATLPAETRLDAAPRTISTLWGGQQPAIRGNQPLSLVIQRQNLRQTTLFGNTLQHGESAPRSQAAQPRMPYAADLPPEPPTHHALDHEAMKTWVYPLNLGAIRDYQFGIVKSSLFHNTLVALPTGLGKTFIAATVILNYYRWTRNAKIVFVAPTKPLASQQVEACLTIAGIPRSETTYLTGETPPARRVDEWASKRVFFMTPQALQNDLSRGYADPKSICLLIVDEAHRATGNYAYVKVVEFLRRFSKSFRVLALTATPGSTVEAVQAVIDSLGISHVEIRTEESLDIRQYVHHRSIDKVILDFSDEVLEVRDLFSKVLQPFVDKLTAQNIYAVRDPMRITAFGMLSIRKEWLQSAGRHANMGLKGMMEALFAILTSLAQPIKLLNFHSIQACYEKLKDFRSEVECKGGKGSKYKRQIVEDKNFQKMMSMIERWLRQDDFIGHPKMTHLSDTILNHFMDAGPGSNTRVIVFSEYRSSAEGIVRAMNKHRPLLKATVFVGQAESGGSEGMTQKQQIETIQRFKDGDFNVLVATSIGEEGLDIGQVDLIVCYDSSKSPIRMLQRMGRTGRKRAGNVVVLLMRGTEELNFEKAQDNYAKIQSLICDGAQFTFRHELSSRILPREVKPEVDKRHVEIPVENTQDTSLPEPVKKGTRGRKKIIKKFHMPDGVETGFVKASTFTGGGAKRSTAVQSTPAETASLVSMPQIESAFLSGRQTEELKRLYTDLPFRDGGIEDVQEPNLNAHPALQRSLRSTTMLKHGSCTRRFVRLMKLFGQPEHLARFGEWPFSSHDVDAYQSIPVKPFASTPDAVSLQVEDIPPTKRRKVGKDASRAAQVRGGHALRATHGRASEEDSLLQFDLSASDMEDEDEASEEDGCDSEDGEDTEKSPPKARGRARGTKATTASKPAKAKKKKKGRPRQRGFNLEEQGDDCTRTSDMDETDGSDSGADLIDFIVGDDVELSSLRGGSTSPTTLSLTPQSSMPAAATRKKKPYFEPMTFTQTQESDDSMPDISDLRSSAKQGNVPVEASQSQSSPVIRTAKAKRRQVLEDSDDD